MSVQTMNFSLLLPTRGRPEMLKTFLTSLAKHTAHPEAVEVLLVMDEDDPTPAPHEP